MNSHVGWSPGKVEIDHHPQGRLWDQAGDLQWLLLFAEFLGDFLAISLVFPCISTRNPHGKPCEINMNSICVGILWAIMDSQKQTSSFHCAQCFWKGTFSEFHQSSRFDHPRIGDFDWGGGLSTLQLADLAGHPWVCRACWGFGFCRMHFLVECDSREIWPCLVCDRFSLSETQDDSGIYIGTIYLWHFMTVWLLYVLFVVERALKQFQGRAQRFLPMPLKVAPLMSTCPQSTCPQWHWWGSTKEPKKSAGGHDVHDFFKAQSPAFGASSSHDEISVCVGASETGV